METTINDMRRYRFVPTSENGTITIPQEWYGRNVEVTICPTDEAEDEAPAHNFTLEELMHPACLVGRTDPKRKAEMDAIFAPYMISLKDFKFDRNEANDYD